MIHGPSNVKFNTSNYFEECERAFLSTSDHRKGAVMILPRRTARTHSLTHVLRPAGCCAYLRCTNGNNSHHYQFRYTTLPPRAPSTYHRYVIRNNRHFTSDSPHTDPFLQPHTVHN